MSHRILVIDDTEDIRAIAGMAIELDPEMVARTCGSGAEGVQIAAKWQPDLILLDVQMPEMSGPETLAILRSSDQTASIPVIFFTASVGKHDSHQKDALLQLGAQGLIPKPFDPMGLAGEIAPFLNEKVTKVLSDAEGGQGDLPPLNDHEKSLLYVSRSLLGQSETNTAVQKIVATAQSKNEHRDVTGALIFTHAHFAQYLEGPSAAVDQLMAAIKLDSRHTDVRLIAIPRFSRRYFGEWTMAYGGSSEYVATLVANVFDNQSEASDPEKLIRLMRELTNNLSDTASPVSA